MDIDVYDADVKVSLVKAGDRMKLRLEGLDGEAYRSRLARAMIELLNPNGSRVETVDRSERVFAIIRACADPLAGLMLARGYDLADRESGEFTHTRREWQADTGIGRHSQETARARLREIALEDGRKIWTERFDGVVRELRYRIDLTVLDVWLSERSG